MGICCDVKYAMLGKQIDYGLTMLKDIRSTTGNENLR